MPLTFDLTALSGDDMTFSIEHCEGFSFSKHRLPVEAEKGARRVGDVIQKLQGPSVLKLVSETPSPGRSNGEHQ